ncbi:MAG: Sua5/YciO/YrdC/YwlC family protein, partial [Candidatus Micrarchaeota archaeon]|nr:Sua5/YciO/YrdC/YwlC family protein [Candidatus Micrarchaeota archaeon]
MNEAILGFSRTLSHQWPCAVSAASEQKKKGETDMKRKTMGKVLALTPEVMRNRTTASKIVNEAADVLGEGGLVIMPTETAYGIAADATNDDAVKKV